MLRGVSFQRNCCAVLVRGGGYYPFIRASMSALETFTVSSLHLQLRGYKPNYIQILIVYLRHTIDKVAPSLWLICWILGWEFCPWKFKVHLTFISNIIFVKQAVFPVPGAPDMYRLPGFPFSRWFCRNFLISVISFSRHSKLLGCEEWRALLTLEYCWPGKTAMVWAFDHR